MKYKPNFDMQCMASMGMVARSVACLLAKSQISSLQPSSMVVQPGLCRSDLVKNHKDWFSHGRAEIINSRRSKWLYTA